MRIKEDFTKRSALSGVRKQEGYRE